MAMNDNMNDNNRTSVLLTGVGAEYTRDERVHMHPIEKELKQRREPAALRAFLRLVAQDAESDDDEERPDCPSTAYTQKDFEKIYAKPKSYITFPRAFLPQTRTMDKEQAAVNCGSSKNPESIDDMMKLMNVMRKILRERLASKVAIAFLAAAKKERISYNKQVVGVWRDVTRAYRHELTKELLEKIFGILYIYGKTDTMQFKKMMFDVMQDLQMWYGCTNQACDTKQQKSGKGPLLVGFLNQVLKDHIRNTYRGTINKIGKETDSHGVILTITKKGGRTDRRDSSVFNFEENVEGWNEQTHVTWQQQNKAVPSHAVLQETSSNLEIFGIGSFDASPDMSAKNGNGNEEQPAYIFDHNFHFSPLMLSYPANNVVARSPVCPLPGFDSATGNSNLDPFRQVFPTAAKDFSRTEHNIAATGAQPTVRNQQPKTVQHLATLSVTPGTAATDVEHNKSTTEAPPATSKQPLVPAAASNRPRHGEEKYTKRKAEEDGHKAAADISNKMKSLTEMSLKEDAKANKQKTTKKRKVCAAISDLQSLDHYLLIHSILSLLLAFAQDQKGTATQTTQKKVRPTFSFQSRRVHVI